jgi:hypothetical protein
MSGPVLELALRCGGRKAGRQGAAGIKYGKPANVAWQCAALSSAQCSSVSCERLIVVPCGDSAHPLCHVGIEATGQQEAHLPCALAQHRPGVQPKRRCQTLRARSSSVSRARASVWLIR